MANPKKRLPENAAGDFFVDTSCINCGNCRELAPTVFRDQLVLHYEIPKWDGDLGRPSAYFPLLPETAQRKVELLHNSFPSQKHRDWWDEEVFLGMARLRGMECRAPYAEAFHCTKFLIH